ncbi:CPBP family intramembrane glutamic endopeptidase [Nodosilinea sp. P-1105]|uniref:CPBP family intramembrane glutamic endopeptidase n=1 Tax=Nodosilinea sp. P-1105 TaxID=2546229 RepID=UPI001469CDBC|nr:CPBP family intramembrane glutamic endopeptidase [Nodosilinea sp. P-1105]NMF86224.1 CPBP family intramembrane metalloprotease [Nodosilinea sp. P-1105]
MQPLATIMPLLAEAPWVEVEFSVTGLVVLGVLCGYGLMVEPWLGVRFFKGFRRASLDPAQQRWPWFAGLIGMQVLALLVIGGLVWQWPELTTNSIGLRWGNLQSPIVLGILGGAIATFIWTSILLIRSPDEADMPLIGDTAFLVPRTPQERLWVGAIALGAGTSEELLYRGLLPALVVGVGVPVAVAATIQAALFGLAHRYQGWQGVGYTALLGLLLGILVVSTGSLLVPIFLHVMIDLRLVLMSQNL